LNYGDTMFHVEQGILMFHMKHLIHTVR